MSSGLRRNSLTLYLRPIADQQPYVLNNVAKWLVARGDFKDFWRARHWLAILEDNHPWQFKTVISQYHDETDVKKSPHKYPLAVNDYRCTSSNIYGDEPHMYY